METQRRIAPASLLTQQHEPGHLDVVPLPEELLSASKPRLCSVCGEKLLDYGSQKLHEVTNHGASREASVSSFSPRCQYCCLPISISVDKSLLLSLQNARNTAGYSSRYSDLLIRYFCSVPKCHYEIPSATFSANKKIRYFASLRYLKEVCFSKSFRAYLLPNNRQHLCFQAPSSCSFGPFQAAMQHVQTKMSFGKRADNPQTDFLWSNSLCLWEIYPNKVRIPQTCQEMQRGDCFKDENILWKLQLQQYLSN